MFFVCNKTQKKKPKPQNTQHVSPKHSASLDKKFGSKTKSHMAAILLPLFTVCVLISKMTSHTPLLVHLCHRACIPHVLTSLC